MIKKARRAQRACSDDTVRYGRKLPPGAAGRIKNHLVYHSLRRRYLQPVLNDFQKRFPQVEVELRLDDRLVDIVSEGFDLAFRVGEPKDSSLIARKIARNRY